MVVIIESDNSIRELVCYALENADINARGFSDSVQFFEYMERNSPSLIMLDIMLPNDAGVHIIQTLFSEQAYRHIPIILLSAKDSELDRVSWLDYGVDDYITKPFAVRELISRVKALLRRTTQNPCENQFTYKSLLLDDNSHTVFINNEQISLTLKEYCMLKTLLECKGTVLSRDELLQKIWGYDFHSKTRTLDVHIRTLRTKLHEYGDYIETVRGVGYRITDEH